MTPRSSTPSRCRYLIALVGVCLLLWGCVSLERIAPPVNEAMLGVARQRGVSGASLENGRLIYLSKCTACHAAEPIDRYSIANWHRILPDMIDESKLNPQDARDLEMYVLLAHEVGPPPNAK